MLRLGRLLCAQWQRRRKPSSRAASSRPGAACYGLTHACWPSSMPSSRPAHGLAVPEYEVLLVLTENGDNHLRMSELADAALLTRSGMTRLVDRLERQGLVRRERCAADGRGTYAVITPEGSGPLRRGPADAHRGRPAALPRPAQEEGSARAGRRVRHRSRRARLSLESSTLAGWMRAVAGTRTRAHARPDSARARPPARRSAGLRGSPRSPPSRSSPHSCWRR